MRKLNLMQALLTRVSKVRLVCVKCQHPKEWHAEGSSGTKCDGHDCQCARYFPEPTSLDLIESSTDSFLDEVNPDNNVFDVVEDSSSPSLTE